MILEGGCPRIARGVPWADSVTGGEACGYFAHFPQIVRASPAPIAFMQLPLVAVTVAVLVGSAVAGNRLARSRESQCHVRRTRRVGLRVA
jgi:hypothetical protein